MNRRTFLKLSATLPAASVLAPGLVARQTVRESVPGYLFVLSTLSLAVVLYLGYASFVLLKAVCLLCLTTYAAVIGLFLVSGAATSFPMTTLPRRAARDARVFIASASEPESGSVRPSPPPWSSSRSRMRSAGLAATLLSPIAAAKLSTPISIV